MHTQTEFKQNVFKLWLGTSIEDTSKQKAATLLWLKSQSLSHSHLILFHYVPSFICRTAYSILYLYHTFGLVYDQPTHFSSGDLENSFTLS